MSHLDIIIANLILVTLLPIVAKAPVAFAMKKLGGGNIGGYDNKHPRTQQQALTGFGARCLAAHQNSFEALIMFAPALILVITSGMANAHTALLISVFSLCRILYLVFYWSDHDKLRSTVLGLGLAINIYLLLYCMG